MLRATIYPILVLLVACGGTGGGAAAGSPTRLATTDLEFGPTVTTADLVIALVDLPRPAPVLMQVAIDLPAALTVAPNEPLQAIQTVPTLLGEKTGSRYIVVCGDDRNPTGSPLQNGALFRLRLQTTTPRQVGTHAIRLTDLLVAQNNGTAASADTNPMTVSVVVN